MAVTLDHHDVRQLDRAVTGDAPHVVAPQVDQHDMLGPFLGIGQQFLGQTPSSSSSRPRLPRAGQRTHRHLAVHDATHDLGRTADQRHARRAQEEHERAGIDDPQGAVDLERVSIGFPAASAD